jgi:hypothetical protein
VQAPPGVRSRRRTSSAPIARKAKCGVGCRQPLGREPPHSSRSWVQRLLRQAEPHSGPDHLVRLRLQPAHHGLPDAGGSGLPDGTVGAVQAIAVTLRSAATLVRGVGRADRQIARIQRSPFVAIQHSAASARHGVPSGWARAQPLLRLPRRPRTRPRGRIPPIRAWRRHAGAGQGAGPAARAVGAFVAWQNRRVAPAPAQAILQPEP